MQDQKKTKSQLLAEIASLKESLTDLRHHFKLFQESEEHYYNLFRDSAVGTVVVMPDGRITQSNKAFCDFLGYSEPELFGKTVLSITHPDDREASSQAITQSFAPGHCIQRFDKRYLHKSGRVLWGEVTITVTCDAEGKPSYHIAQVLDINERKQAEEALRKSEAKYRRLNQSMMDAFVSVNMDGFVQEFNDAYCQMLAYEPEEIVKLRYTDITPEKWHSFQAEIIEKQVLTRGYSEIYEKEYRRKDGTIFPVELRTCLVKDEKGRPVAMWAIIRDITERKRAEAALLKAHDELERRVEERTAELTKTNERLRQTNDELQTIYDGMVEGLLVTDIETKRFVRVNPAMCRMLGYSEEELLTASIKDIHPPEEVPNDLQRFQAAAEGRVSINEDRPVLRKDGSVFYADITGHRVFYDERPCLLALFRDITERKQAENKLAYLASFPERNPNPITEVGMGGDIRYVNPAAQRLFPELREQGLKHPWLGNWEVVQQFGESPAKIAILEVAVGDRKYQQSFDYVAQDGVVRIYGIDVTERT